MVAGEEEMYFSVAQKWDSEKSCKSGSRVVQQENWENSWGKEKSSELTHIRNVDLLSLIFGHDPFATQKLDSNLGSVKNFRFYNL